jgi:hypothetical protein
MLRLLVALAVTLGAVAQGQADSARQPTRFCWAHVQPAPRCSAFLVTEIGVEHPMYTTRLTTPNAQGWTGDYYATRLNLAAGVMVNNGASRAIGFVGGVDPQSQDVVLSREELRYRVWRESKAYDIGAGLAQYDSGVKDPARGITASVGVEASRFAGDVRLDLMRANGRAVRGVFVSGRLTSINAPIAIGLAGLAVLLWPREEPVF